MAPNNPDSLQKNLNLTDPRHSVSSKQKYLTENHPYEYHSQTAKI